MTVICWRLIRLGLAGIVALAADSPVTGQSLPPQMTAKAPAAPEPIYWRQNLFLIPYQWTSTTDPSSAEAVWLYVSKDRGTSWQKISEAKPQVKAFNYHAEADGEYWFAIRTQDTHGRSWPDSPLQAELKVIVDTTIPRFGELSGLVHDGDMLDIQWQIADANLDAATCKVDVQPDDAGPWQTVPLPNSAPTSDGVFAGMTPFQLPSGCRTATLRATVYDRAGNRAVYQTSVNPNPPGVVAQPAQWPTLITGRGDGPSTTTASPPPKIASPLSTPALPQTDTSTGWVSSSSSTVVAKNEDHPVVSQPWPAGNSARSTTSILRGNANGNGPNGAAVTFGKPQVLHDAAADSSTEPEKNSASNRFVTFGGSPADIEPDRAQATGTHLLFSPLEPFREPSSGHQASTNQAPTSGGIIASNGNSPAPVNSSGPPPAAATNAAWTGGAAPKWVNSRTFALEYELENISERGVAKVELWGTRDNGQTWRSYAIDDDNRSPLQVTVDDEGLFGFRIVVQGAGGPGGFAPRPGDRPELWVGVDLHRPQVDLTAAEAGSGDLAGRVLLRWRATDDHLDPRPIGLFYSSRPTGPWSTIATNLENSGQYDWQVERHVPSRIYLRVEARDLAGNRAAYQTSDAVVVELPLPSGRPGGVTPLGPTANESNNGYR